MKKILLNVFSLMLVMGSMAQDNNPYNKRGVDYHASIQIISADYQAGKVKEINEASLKTYSKLIPLQNQVSMNLASSVVKAIKAPGFSFSGLLKQSTLSAYSKEVLPQLLNVKRSSREVFQQFLKEKVNEINKATLSTVEKESLLTLVAIVYHSPAATTSRLADCNIETPTYSGPVSGETCLATAMVSGFMIGISICSIWCGIGGAVIAGVAYALS